MVLLPDIAAATLYAVVVFLLVLGVLIVFVETVQTSRLSAIVVADLGIAAFLGFAGEIGTALVVLAVSGSFLANHAFEWLTTR